MSTKSPRAHYRVRSESPIEKPRQSKAAHLYVISENLGFLASIIYRLIARDLDRRFRDHGASFGQFPVLVQLWAEDGQTQRQIADRIVIDKATLTNTLNRMGRGNTALIERRADENDLRVQRIYLTAKGRELRDELVEEALESNAFALAELSQSEKIVLRQLLTRVIASIQKRQQTACSH